VTAVQLAIDPPDHIVPSHCDRVHTHTGAPHVQMVYSASSAADAMSVKAEAFFNGWGVGVSAEVTKQETSASMKSGIFFDYCESLPISVMPFQPLRCQQVGKHREVAACCGAL